MNKPAQTTLSKAMIHLFLLVLLMPAICFGGSALSVFSHLHKAGLMVLDGNGQTLMAENAQMPLMPASTTKLVTAWLALTHWGEAHRFRTQFYLDESSQTLWVKGSGDPYLVSEELNLIARNLKNQGLQRINAIGVDTSLFQSGLVLPGTGGTDNPYDAVPTAVAANFNTIAVRRLGSQIVSAEAVTPLTPFAEQFGRTIRSGELRVNTGPDPRNAETHFAELLGAFLQKHGVSVGNRIVYGQSPNNNVFYTHENSKTLAEIVRMMLKYSTNFVANQLILMLSADAYHRPANTADVQRYMEETLAHHFAWRNFSLADGAGLSRTNRLSPQQLTELLLALRQWKHLLPEVEPGIYAKTGTLTGVSSLAGYLVKSGEWQPFAVVMNEHVPYHLRNQIARELSAR